MRAHLYEPFHTSKEATGTGLGLWISKGILEKHRGRIAMRSHCPPQPPQAESTGSAAPRKTGTVFAIWLPLA
jgi:signal transduction histidine kinase